MAMANTDFDQRIRVLTKKHKKLQQGYVMTVNDDGLIVAKPYKVRRKLPLRGIVLLMGAVVLFKALLLASHGATEYNARIAALSNGSNLEQLGGYVMKSDPATEKLASILAPLLRN